MKGLTKEQRVQVVQDAGRVRAYVQRNPWIGQKELAGYAERNMTIDRLNAAVALLRETEQVYEMPDELPPGVPPPEPQKEPDAPAKKT
jgi:hypothetical protein